MAESAPETQSMEDIHPSRLRGARKGQHPTLTKPVYKLRAYYYATAKSMMSKKNEVNQMIYNDYNLILSVDYFSRLEVSTTPLKLLQRMTLEELRLEEYVRGKHLLLRIIDPAYSSINGITCVVEDHVGNAVLYCIRNYPIPEQADLLDIFPLGSIFFLKEPYCDESGDGHCVLHCGCPSDMIAVYVGHPFFRLADGVDWMSDVMDNYVNRSPLPSTSKEWLDRCISLISESKVESATRCCYLALEQTKQSGDRENMLKTVLLRMVLLLMARGHFEASLEFCKQLVNKEPDCLESNFLTGINQCLLCSYKKGKPHFEKCLVSWQRIKEVEVELKLCMTNIDEQDVGEFDILGMFNKQLANPQKPIDCANFIGPIEISHMKSKGNGIIAKNNIEPGTLLVVSKALVFRWKPKDGSGVTPTQIWLDLILALVKLVKDRPKSCGEMVYKLYDGTKSLEGSPNTRVFCDENAKVPEPIIDVRKLAGIVKNNLFGEGVDVVGLQIGLKKNLQTKSGCGVFNLPSYFNHNCMPNATIHHINDVIVIRAAHFIKKKEEIFLPYLPWETPYTIRQMYCTSRGFSCGCKFCQVEGKETLEVVGERNSILLEHEHILQRMTYGNVSNVPDLIQYIHTMIERLKATYPDNCATYPDKAMLSIMYSLMAKAHSVKVTGRCWDPAEELKYHELTLKHLGYNLQDVVASLKKDKNSKEHHALLDVKVLRTVASIVYIYSQTNQHANKMKWVKILTQLENYCTGGGLPVAKLRFPNIKDHFHQ